jgi:hypothetical protein
MNHRTRSDSPAAESASRLINARIEEQADPTATEEWKWRGVPVWSHGGIICTGESYTNLVKVTFAKGAHLALVRAAVTLNNAKNRRRK